MTSSTPLSRYTQHFNPRLAFSVLLIAVSQFNYGFDNQAFATTQAMEAFNRQFGKCDTIMNKCDIPSHLLSLLNGLPYIGFAIGLIIGSLISQVWGRRMAIFCMSLYALGSATVVITAQTFGHILAGRILNYVYVGMELATVPVYQSEIVPAPVRGLVVSTYQLSLNSGGLVINGIAKVTGSLPDRRAYMIPFGLFYIVPSIVIAFIWLIPESPRWLMTKGRIEEARMAHESYRRGTMSAMAIEKEFEKLHQALTDESEQGKSRELFQGNNLKRTAIVVGMNFFQQATGQAFASQYGARFIRSLETVDPFSITTANSGISILVLITALLLSDRLGRRCMLQIGGIIQMAAMLTMGSLGLQEPLPARHKQGIIGMFILFSVGFAFGWAPLTYVVTTELPALRLRDRNQRVASLVNIFMNFLVNFTVPYMLSAPYANLNSKVGFIFGAVTLLAMVFVYFCVPECKGRSLEEIDRMFNDGVPIRQFRAHEWKMLGDSGVQGQSETRTGRKLGSHTAVMA